MTLRLATLCALFGLAAVASTGARAAIPMPEQLKAVRLENKLGQTIPLDTTFFNERGRQVKLADFFGGHTPVVVIPVYFNCPSLCNYTLNGFVTAMKGLKLVAGKDFQVLTVSIDPAEQPELAAAKKASYISDLGAPEAAAGWHFLTGRQPQIDALTAALGFRYSYDPKAKLFDHAPAVYVLSPAGKVSRLFPSIAFDGRDLRLALVEASEGKVGSLSDLAILYCSHFDPATGKYTWFAMRVMRIGGGLTLLALLWMIGSLVWFERRRARSAPAIPTHKETPQGPAHA